MAIKYNKVMNAQKSLYKACGFKFTNPIVEAESKEYYAHYYRLGNQYIRFRIAKKTPAKSGQFVAMWKRMHDGTISPYDQVDDVDFFVVNTIHEDKIGQFVFPKSTLVAKNIFSINGKTGKLAIRVYCPWDITKSKQASRTKEWQIKYFIEITPNGFKDTELAKKLYGI